VFGVMPVVGAAVDTVISNEDDEVRCQGYPFGPKYASKSRP
jgi:hypothetical protein